MAPRAQSMMNSMNTMATSGWKNNSGTAIRTLG